MAVGRGMVTTVVKELLAEGAVYEGALTDVPRGRRPKMLHVQTRDRLVVAIDIRFSRTYLLLSDFGGNQLALESFETVFDPGQLLDELAMRVRRLLRTHAAGAHCEGIGIVIPGMVDRRSGRVFNAPQLGWRDVQVRPGGAYRAAGTHREFRGGLRARAPLARAGGAEERHPRFRLRDGVGRGGHRRGGQRRGGSGARTHGGGGRAPPHRPGPPAPPGRGAGPPRGPRPD